MRVTPRPFGLGPRLKKKEKGDTKGDSKTKRKVRVRTPFMLCPNAQAVLSSTPAPPKLHLLQSTPFPAAIRSIVQNFRHAYTWSPTTGDSTQITPHGIGILAHALHNPYFALTRQQKKVLERVDSVPGESDTIITDFWIVQRLEHFEIPIHRHVHVEACKGCCKKKPRVVPAGCVDGKWEVHFHEAMTCLAQKLSGVKSVTKLNERYMSETKKDSQNRELLRRSSKDLHVLGTTGFGQQQKKKKGDDGDIRQYFVAEWFAARMLQSWWRQRRLVLVQTGLEGY